MAESATLNIVENRVRRNYPSLLIMMVSLIVALVFENLVAAIREQSALWDGSPESFFFLSQCFIMLVGPMTYWFTFSLHSPSSETTFNPRDILSSIVAASSVRHRGIRVSGIRTPQRGGPPHARDNRCPSPEQHSHARRRRRVSVGGRPAPNRSDWTVRSRASGRSGCELGSGRPRLLVRRVESCDGRSGPPQPAGGPPAGSLRGEGI